MTDLAGRQGALQLRGLRPQRRARGRSDETAAKCIYVGMSAGIAGPLLTTPCRFQISFASTLASDLKNFILTQPCAF